MDPKAGPFLSSLVGPLFVHGWFGFSARPGTGTRQKTVPYIGPLFGAARTNLCKLPVGIPDPISGAVFGVFAFCITALFVMSFGSLPYFSCGSHGVRNRAGKRLRFRGRKIGGRTVRLQLWRPGFWSNRWPLFGCLPVRGNGRVGSRGPAWTRELCTANSDACYRRNRAPLGMAEIVNVLFGLFRSGLEHFEATFGRSYPRCPRFVEALGPCSGLQLWTAKSALSQRKVNELWRRRRRSEALPAISISVVANEHKGKVSKFRARYKAGGARMGSPCPLCLCCRGRE